jgi:prepilin-type N-terminal cleavage/methylation domain-containing protein
MKRPPDTQGFTLLELLVAVTITLLLAGLMLVVVTNTLNLWHRTQDSFTTATQARLVLDLVERDLQAAAFRTDGGTWLAVEVSNSPASLSNHGWLVPAGPIKPATGESLRLLPASGDGAAPLIRDARFGLSGAWLRFITTNVESGGSLPVAVSYQIARRPVSGAILATTQADVRYTLFRSAVSPAGTLTAGNDVTAPAYGSTSVSPAGPRTPATLTNANNSDALATNVVDFGAWLHVRDTATAELRRIFPADNNDLVHTANGTATDANRFPAVVDALVRILTEQGATLLAQIENGSGRITRPPDYATDAEWWWAVVEANSRVYTRRIEVKGVSL